jgi:hypothetical protein
VVVDRGRRELGFRRHLHDGAPVRAEPTKKIQPGPTSEGLSYTHELVIHAHSRNIETSSGTTKIRAPGLRRPIFTFTGLPSAPSV